MERSFFGTRSYTGPCLPESCLSYYHHATKKKEKAAASFQCWVTHCRIEQRGSAGLLPVLVRRAGRPVQGGRPQPLQQQLVEGARLHPLDRGGLQLVEARPHVQGKWEIVPELGTFGIF